MPRRRKYSKQRRVPNGDARAALRDLADTLRHIAYDKRPDAHLVHEIDPKLARWVACAIRLYLARDVPLERALGLEPSRGRPRKPATPDELKTGVRIFELLLAGKSWRDVARDIGWQKEESGLRELWQRIEPDVNAEISRQITELARGQIAADFDTM